MYAEPSYDADGDVSAWHFWRGADLVVTLERINKTSWKLTRASDGAQQIFMRRRDALAAIRNLNN